ncbi:MAG: tryptophan--tRNA ligase [Deltaproteobacteria bacterium]|nr:tryptophan--tRNA ligase [Deltaproteobacteria bacterium]
MTAPEGRVFSGIQPSGEIHVGNYLGAVKKWVELTATHDCIYCVVDDHAMTQDFDPALLPRLTFDAVLTTMACGLDPSRCTIFVQSHVPEHTELCWLFNTVTPLGSLFRMTQFKEKSRNALHKALAFEGESRSAAMHQLRNAGDGAVKMALEIEPLLAEIHPEGETDPAVAARLNDALGNLMQHLQVGLGVSDASTGLFDYPVLMAADILLYKAELVPVGEDQEQHLQLAREVAERFNKRFCEVFPMARRIPGEAPRILGLDGRRKMSKSLGNHIGVLDPSDVVEKKLAQAFTDPQRQRRRDPGRPEMCNVFTLHGHFTPAEKRDELAAGCRSAGIGCFDCKKVLAAGVNAELAPIREQAARLAQRPDEVLSALDRGRERCGTIAAATMDEVRGAMGIGRAALATRGGRGSQKS